MILSKGGFEQQESEDADSEKIRKRKESSDSSMYESNSPPHSRSTSPVSPLCLLPASKGLLKLLYDTNATNVYLSLLLKLVSKRPEDLSGSTKEDILRSARAAYCSKLVAIDLHFVKCVAGDVDNDASDDDDSDDDDTDDDDTVRTARSVMTAMKITKELSPDLRNQFRFNVFGSDLTVDDIRERALVERGVVSGLMERARQTDNWRKNYNALSLLARLCETHQHIMPPSLKQELLDLAVAMYRCPILNGRYHSWCELEAKSILAALRDDLERAPTHRQLCLQLGYSPVDSPGGGTGDSGRKRKSTGSHDTTQVAAASISSHTELPADSRTISEPPTKRPATTLTDRQELSSTSTWHPPTSPSALSPIPEYPLPGVVQHPPVHRPNDDTPFDGSASRSGHAMELSIVSPHDGGNQNADVVSEHVPRPVGDETPEREKETRIRELEERIAQLEKERSTLERKNNDLEEQQTRDRDYIKSLEDELRRYKERSTEVEEEHRRNQEKTRELEEEHRRYREKNRELEEEYRRYKERNRDRETEVQSARAQSLNNADTEDGEATNTATSTRAGIYTEVEAKENQMVQLVSGHHAYLYQSQLDQALNASRIVPKAGGSKKRSKCEEAELASESEYIDGPKLARRLMQVFFTVEERKAGTVAKKPTSEYTQLDEKITNAILAYCLSVDKTTSRGKVGSAMASCLTELRSRGNKKPTSKGDKPKKTSTSKGDKPQKSTAKADTEGAAAEPCLDDD